jgi:phosphatidylglycerophosphatase A
MSIKQRLSLLLATCGVGYIPVAPGTWGSALAVLGYLTYQQVIVLLDKSVWFPLTAVLLLGFCLVGISASRIAAETMGEKDPVNIVVDEVMGQWVTFAFVPFTSDWKILLAGFALFRLFDIWKPFPIDRAQDFDGGIGVCADDLIAGVYAGVTLSILTLIL